VSAGRELPRVVVHPPGPRSRALAERIERVEAPVVNTLFGGRPSVVWSEAVGSNILDVDGNRYLDLTSGLGVAAVGHRHPAVEAAVVAQASRLLHGLADVASIEPRIALAERLGVLAPMADARVYFAVSGSDAVEIALKTARLATGRAQVLAFEPAYHGCTLGALSVTSRDEFRRPFASHLDPAVTRLPWGGPLDEVERALAGAAHAAAIVEPVLGREGISLPPAGWLAGLSALCDAHGALLVADEIYTAFGRTGHLFACVADGVVPDLLCCGKALGGGLPIAAVLGRADLMRCWDREGEALHTATFLAHPLACAASLAALEVIESDDLVARAASLGGRVAERAGAWSDIDGVRSVRGRGLAWTVELDSAATAGHVAAAALARGLILLAAGPRLQIAPPLVITEEQLDFALDALGDLLADRG
jgi:4-aminobutyrate aminotransferase-like enzyme